MHPPRLIKTFSRNSDAQNFVQGTIILRCLNYFRMCEDERGDDSESTVKHSGREGMPTITTLGNDSLILSLWTPPANWAKEGNKFGKHHVEIIDPCALFSEIQARLTNVISQAYFGKVDYMDYGKDVSNPEDQKKALEKVKKTQFYCEKVYLGDTTGPLEDGSLGIECIFIKRKEFQDEKETRMAFLFKLTISTETLNQHKNIHVNLWKKETKHEFTSTSLTTITETTLFSDYDTWKVGRYDQGNKRHWIEVILSDLPTHFFKFVD